MMRTIKPISADAGMVCILFDDVRMNERTGRPIGAEGFVMEMSLIAGRELGRKRPEPKKSKDN